VSTLELGSELAGYRIEALIGRGGMGIVYRGTDLRLGRPVAIKLIAADRASDDRIRQRFEREARLMAALDHPNVLPVYAAGEEDGDLYLVMRYVNGTDLGGLLRSQHRLEPRRATAITAQVAEALDAAHAAGLVHRDIKPANVLLAGGHTYLSDFGIGQALDGGTRLTDSNEWLGTVDFCSPEQLRGDPVDARSDIYALGCLLHTILTGTPPHHRETAAATMLAHLGDDPPPPSRTDPSLASFDPILARALAKPPSERFESARALGRAAAAAAAGPAASASGPAVSASRPAVPAGGPGRFGRSEPRRRRPGGPASTSRPRRQTTTRLDLRPPRDRGRGDGIVDRRRPRARRAAIVAATSAVLIAVIAGLVILITPGAGAAGPLTQADVTGVVSSFATDYGTHDLRALGQLLAPSVVRMSTSETERGRDAVLAEYRNQLTDRSITGYRVTALKVEGGWVGRASAQYSVLRGAQVAASGNVTFGVERVGGRPEVGLIATQPPA
jgi:predicted Ser/Thr protein kinase